MIDNAIYTESPDIPVVNDFDYYLNMKIPIDLNRFLSSHILVDFDLQ